MKIYGLTGGIASGKSEAARRFASHAIPVIDADRVGHEVIAPGGAAEESVADAFGSEILTCGRIDREKLGGMVFGNPSALKQLNGLVRPAIDAEIMRRCAQSAADGHGQLILDAALLAEGGAREEWLAGLAVVVCRRDEQLRRLVERRSMAVEEAERRIASQALPESKMALADWIIENDGDLKTLHTRVDEIAEVICGEAG